MNNRRPNLRRRRHEGRSSTPKLLPGFRQQTNLHVHNTTRQTSIMADATPRQGDLSWKLSSHPITLVTFLGFRTGTLQHLTSTSPPGFHTNSLCHSKSTSLHTRPLVHAELHPRLRPHRRPPLLRLLLPQEHSRQAPSRPTMVERSQCADRGFALGV